MVQCTWTVLIIYSGGPVAKHIEQFDPSSGWAGRRWHGDAQRGTVIEAQCNVDAHVWRLGLLVSSTHDSPGGDSTARTARTARASAAGTGYHNATASPFESPAHSRRGRGTGGGGGVLLREPRPGGSPRSAPAAGDA